MANEFVKNLAVEQRKRLVASLMECFEKQVVPTVPAGQRNAVTKVFRDKVMSSVGQYHDTMLDCLKASVSDGMLANDEALVLLRELRVVQDRLSRELSGG